MTSPSIATEMSLFDRSVTMAETAFSGIQSLALEARHANAMLGAARVLQTAAKGRISARLVGGKLTLAEARLIESDEQAALSQRRETAAAA